MQKCSLTSNKITQAEPRWRLVKQLEECLKHEFDNYRLLELALTHSSWANDQGQSTRNNERLEFLGDAVLELCISQELYKRFPAAREGTLTQMRSQLVNEATLAEIARKIGLNHSLRLGNGEEQQGGREKNSLLADALEAVLAALFLDSDYNTVHAIILDLFADALTHISPKPQRKDAKTQLQEVCYKNFGKHPIYKLEDAEGPPHEKIYSVVLFLPNGMEFMATGKAHKKAEQEAAQMALKRLLPESDMPPDP